VPIESECDVAVIGAGVAGLTAAGLLAKAGLSVVVVESQPVPGGYLAGFQRQGFHFDSAIQWLNQCQPGGIVERVLSHVGPGFPECPPLRRIRRYRGDSFDYLLTDHPLELRDRLAADFPAQADGLRRLFEDARTMAEWWRVLSLHIRAPVNLKGLEFHRTGLAMLWHLLPALKHMRAKTPAGLARYVSDPQLTRMFCSETGFLAVLMPISWAFLGDYQAPPRGGGQALITWLAGLVESLGVRLRLGEGAERVLVRNGCAGGLQLEGGATVRSRWVVAACDVDALYTRLLPAGAVPERLVRHVREADLYDSHLSVFLGLDCPAQELGFGEELTFLTRDDVTRAEHAASDPHKAAITVLAPSVRDPTLAPPGRGTLTLHCAARMEYGNAWQTGEGRERGPAYRQFKREYADVLLERVARQLAPELKRHVVFQDVATPVTFWRYTGNREGVIMAARPTGRNIRRRVARYRTPVGNLLVGGQWAEYGGGVPLAVKAAANASLLILAETRPDAHAALCDVMDAKAARARP
jgi:prolycopene isomerase